MEKKKEGEKSVEMLRTRIRTLMSQPVETAASPSASTIEEQMAIGHSRNSRKKHYYEISRD